MKELDMKNVAMISVLSVAIAVSTPVLAAPAAPAAAPSASAPVLAAPVPVAGGYSVEDTDIGTLLDDPAAKAIVTKQIPALGTDAQAEMARSLTLKTVQQYAPDMITDEKLAAIQAELNKLPVKK